MRHAIISAVLLAVACPAAWGQETRGDRAFGQVVTIEITGVADKIQGDEICRRVPQLMPPGEYITRYGQVKDGNLWARAAPIADVMAFAAKIDFGKVTNIDGRTIYVTARPVPGFGTPAASALNRALAGINSSSRHVRRSALEQLIEMPPNGSRDQVIQALYGPFSGTDSDAKALSVKAIGIWGGKASTPVMLKVLATPGDYRDSSARRAAMKVLSEFKDPTTIEPIARRLTDVCDRSEAISSLVAFGPSAETATLGVLANKDGDTRIGACEVLEKIGTKSSVAPLVAVTKDTNKRVSSAATSALKSIYERSK